MDAFLYRARASMSRCIWPPDSSTPSLSNVRSREVSAPLGRLSTFSPRTELSRTGITQIRPMLYLQEHEIAAFSRDLPVLRNCCPVNHETKREYMKQLLKNLNGDIPFAKDRIFVALTSPERYQLFDKFERECREEEL